MKNGTRRLLTLILAVIIVSATVCDDLYAAEIVTAPSQAETESTIMVDTKDDTGVTSYAMADAVTDEENADAGTADDEVASDVTASAGATEENTAADTDNGGAVSDVIADETGNGGETPDAGDASEGTEASDPEAYVAQEEMTSQEEVTESDTQEEVTEDVTAYAAEDTEEQITEEEFSYGYYTLASDPDKKIAFSSDLDTLLTSSFYYNNTNITSISIPAYVEEIDSYAFANCTKLKSVKFQKGSKLNYIGNYAFRDCSSLASITLPDSVTGMGYDCFLRCTSLKSANVPAGMTAVREDTFRLCKALQNVKIPEGITEIEDSAFSSCTSLKTINLPNSITTLRYSAFANCSGLESVVLPSSLETMEEYIFQNCTSLKNVSFPDNLKKIGYWDFNGCSSLATITLPNNLEEISQRVFEGTGIKKLYIPSKVNSILGSSFKGMSYLEEIEVAADNTTYRSIDGVLYDITDGGQKLLHWPEAKSVSEIYVPDGVTAIDLYVFRSNTAVEKISLPDSITELDTTFYGCSNLRTVEFRGDCKLTALTSNLFYGCEKLQKVVFLGTSEINSIYGSAFSGCSSLERIDFADNSKDISVQGGAFSSKYEFQGLFNGGEPAALGDIGSKAFANCRSLERVHFGASATSIASDAFIGTYGIKEYIVDAGNSKYLSLEGSLCEKNLEIQGIACEVALTAPAVQGKSSFTVPEGVTGIGDHAFSETDTLRDVTIASTVKVIGEKAFAYGASLYEVTFRENPAIQLIGHSAFYECDKLMKVDFANAASLTEIGPYAFYDCDDIEEMPLPDSIEYIDDYAFYYNYFYELSALPQNLKSIGDYAFYNTAYIKDIKFNSALESIGEGAFKSCYNLVRVDLSEATSLEEIGREAFRGCNVLKEFDMSNCTALRRINLEALSYTALESIKVPEGVTHIGPFAFQRCSNLKTAELPSTLTDIGNDGYYTGYYSYLGSYMFAYDTKLQSVVIRNDAMVFGDYMFYKGAPTVTIYGTPDSSAQSYVDAYEEEDWCTTTVAFRDINEYTGGSEGVITDSAGIFAENNKVAWTYTNGKLTIGPASPEYTDLAIPGSAPWFNVIDVDNISEIEIADGISDVKALDLYNYYAVKKLTIAGTVKIIPKQFAYNLNIEELVLRDGVTEIGTGAFMYCYYMKTMTLPQTLEIIGNEAFSNCRELTSLTIPGSVRKIGRNAFYNDYSITDVTFAEGVKEVSDYVFYNCYRIKRVTIPASMEYIGEKAFCYCEDVEEVVFPAGNENFEMNGGVLYYVTTDAGTGEKIYTQILVTKECRSGDGIVTISDYFKGDDCYAYVYEDNITGFSLGEGNTEYAVRDGVLYSYDGTVLYRVPTNREGVFIVPATVTRIGSGAFYECDKLTEIVIPDSVNKLGNYTCYDCTALEAVKLGNGITEIPAAAFLNCKKLNSVNIPAKVTYIGSDAFENTVSLERVIIPPSVIQIGSYAFAGSGIRNVTFSEGLEMIYRSAFSNCRNLTAIELPGSLRKIEGSAFDYCTHLRAVVFGSGVTDIYTLTQFSNKYTSFDHCPWDIKIYGEYGSLVHSVFSTARFRDVNGNVRSFNFVENDSSKYYIRYMLNENAGEKNSADNPSSYRKYDQKITLAPAEKDGFIFGGWYSDSKFNNRVEYIYPQNGLDYVLYPRWYKKCQVTFKDQETVLEVREVGESLPLGEYDTPVRTGYDFASWVTDAGIEYDESTPVCDDITLKAVYTAKGTRIVKAPSASVSSGNVESGMTVTLNTATEGGDIFYTLDGTDPTAEPAHDPYTGPITLEGEAGDKIVLKAIACEDGVTSGISEYTYTVSATEDYWGDITYKDRGEDMRSVDDIPEGLWVSGLQEEVLYTGDKITFPIKVFYGNKLLEAGRDYTVSYKNNINAASADSSKAPSVTVKGKGYYKGSITETFTIKAIDLAEVWGGLPNLGYCLREDGDPSDPNSYSYIDDIASYYYGYYYDDGYVVIGTGQNFVSLRDLYQNYTTYGVSISCPVHDYPADGKPHKAAPVVMKNGKKLTKDVKIEYPDAEYTSPGFHNVKIVGKGNLTGEYIFKFKLVENGVDIKKVKISGFKSKLEYNGASSATMQTGLKLTYNGDTLERDADYDLTYTNASAPGKATLTITGLGKYAGTITKNYTIIGIPMKKVKVNNFVPTVEFNGKAQYQSGATLKYKDKTRDIDLVAGSNYTVTYVKNVKAGKATVIYTGKGAFTGELKKTFTIKPYDMNADSKLRKPLISVECSQEAAYSKSGAVPELKVFYKGSLLTEGTDYKLSYKNNKAYPVASGKQPVVTITGKGSYKGKLETRFNISKKSLATLSLDASNVVFRDAVGNYVPKLTINDTDGKALAAGKDYQVEGYVYTAPVRLLDGTERGRNDAVQVNDAVPAGTLLKVSIVGIGGYEGTVSDTYRVYEGEKDIAKAKITIADKTYTGKEIRLNSSDISIELNGTVLKANEYEIVGYKKNIKTGKASVTLKGIKGYGGVRTVTFNIKQKDYAGSRFFYVGGPEEVEMLF
ncbi:MAG: leucine-rich repeat protein [Lachnospiraceae bacterium]|nr:leucine-rich repeat protein [Lachnospiraceae bacterium]